MTTFTCSLLGSSSTLLHRHILYPCAAADRALARAAERARALVDDDFENGGDAHARRRDRGLQDLPRPALAERPERPAIGFGGAVQRRGDQQVRYLPAPRRELPRPSRQYRRLAFGIHSDGDDDDDDDDYIPPDEHDMDEGRHEALAAGVQRRAAAAAQPQPPIHPNRRVNVPMDNAAAPRRGLPSAIQERQDRLREMDGILFGGYDAEDLEGRPRIEGVAPIRGLGGGFGGLFGRLGRMLPRFHDGEDFAEAMGLRFDVGGAAAGPGPGRNAEQDLETKLSQIQCPKSPEPLKGFEASFDLEASVPIVIDAEDDSPPREVYFECPMCLDPLRVSSGYRSAQDRVWVLRCGHMIDQKCLHKLATPTTPEQIKNVINWSGDLGYLPILGGDEPPPPAKKKRKTTKKSNGPVIHVWKCPVEGCGVLHTSQKKELNPGEEDLDGDGARWVQTEDGGAIAAFM